MRGNPSKISVVVTDSHLSVLRLRLVITRLTSLPLKLSVTVLLTCRWIG